MARTLLAARFPELANQMSRAIAQAADQLQSCRGVLVIYTGGTIGSAPKDEADPESPQIVLPWRELRNAVPQIGRLGYPVDAVSFVEPLDSCNVGPTHWRAIAHLVQKHYEEYEGFVVIHGTDTIGYTAAALSFMLVDLAKPVVLTGAQVSGIVNVRNDAHQNLINATMIANPLAHNLPMIPEVVVIFGDQILRGNRTKKLSTFRYQGFGSPNCPPLGRVGEYIALDRQRLQTMPATDLQVFEDVEPKVIMLEVFPGMEHSPVIQNVLADKNLRGLVLKSYGTGNTPTSPEFLCILGEFIDKGGIVVNVTGVIEGEVELPSKGV